MIKCKPSGLLALSLFLSLFGFGANADQISLGLSINCAMGTDCFVQNHFDHVPGAEPADYTCSSLVYDGHDGTDFRTRTMTNMRAGVEVLAAALGVVVGIRNMMEDVLVGDIGRKALEMCDTSDGVASIMAMVGSRSALT